MADEMKTVLGLIAFSVFWVLAVFPAVPFLPIGRTAGSLLGAVLMILFHVITPEQAYAVIDLPILGLLFGTMVLGVYLEQADMFKYLGTVLSYKRRGSKDLLCRVCLISAISSALFTNDTTCIVLTEFVLKIVRENDFPPKPFLLALASSANIGSAATPIGNPQNLIIAVQSKISFMKFFASIVPSLLLGIVVNIVILQGMFWRSLSVDKHQDKDTSEISAEEEISHRFSPVTMSHPDSPVSLEGQVIHGGISEQFHSREPANRVRNQTDLIEHDRRRVLHAEIVSLSSLSASKEYCETSQATVESGLARTLSGCALRSNTVILPRTSGMFRSLEEKGRIERWKRPVWKMCVYLVTIAMLVSLLIGLNLSWTAITAAISLVVIDFRDARPCFEKVSYQLLLFFCGMFITIQGFNRTGIPSRVWSLMEPYSQIDHASGTAFLALVILVLSNVASNVPTVMLLGPRVAASAAATSFASERKAWLILAWVSTVAGNLSLLGSAANLIVCEQAQHSHYPGYTLSFWGHLQFGVPSTLIVTAVGLPLIRG